MKVKTTWDLNPLYLNENDPKIEKDLTKAKKKSYEFINKWKDRTDYLEKPQAMKEALDEYELWSRDYGSTGAVGYYLSLRSALEQTNNKLKAQSNKLHTEAVRIWNDIQFFEISISKIPPEQQKKFLENSGLSEYKHLLERVFAEGKYTLTDAEEKIMNYKHKTSLDNWVRMVDELFSKEELKVLDDEVKPVTKPFNEVLNLISSKNKKVRKKAASALEKTFEKHLDVVEHEMNTVLENLKVNCEIRGYERPDSARHLADDISSEVVDTLVDAVSSRFEIPKRYYKFKAKLLGQNKLEYYERSVEYGEVNKKYPYREAVNLVLNTFKQLDSEFAEIFSNFVQRGHFDVFPKKGKTGGAFCTCWGIKEPTYILLNHTDRLNDVLTIAHESGHGINNELIKKKQKNLNFGTPTSTAEVASTYMEDFVLEKLLETANDEEKLVIRMMKLDADVATIFRQISFYQFETELHHNFRENGYIPKEEIGKMFNKHMKAYMGEAAKGSENWWVYVSHFRRFFYVYSYSSGLLISKALQAKTKENPEFVSKVKEFLAAGITDSPKNIFMKMGIDISKREFWLDGIKEIDQYFKDTVELAKKLGKI